MKGRFNGKKKTNKKNILMKTSGKSWAKYIDSKKKARKSGYRKSKVTGERYYEDRPNHSDEDAKTRLAHGGMTEHGLEVGDKITGNFGHTIGGYNKDERERFVTDLDKGKRTSSKYAKGGKTKKGKQDPPIVRGYFEDEPYEYGGGGAIYKGDKVKIKGSNKSMVVKNIAKGKKGYVEFTGDAGTYLKGDLEKFADGGGIKVNLGSGEMDLEDAIKMYEDKIKSQGRITNERDENMLKQLKSMRPKMADGGEVGSDNYKVVKVFRKSGRKVVLEKYLTREEAMRVVARYPNSNTSMVIFTKMFEEGGMTSGWCYSIGGL